MVNETVMMTTMSKFLETKQVDSMHSKHLGVVVDLYDHKDQWDQ